MKLRFAKLRSCIAHNIRYRKARVMLLLSFLILQLALVSCAQVQQIYVQYNASSSVYSLTTKEPEQWAARGTFKNEINQTGWSSLHIETKYEYDNKVQAYAAGLAEGNLTHALITHNWRNSLLDQFCPLPYSPDCQKLHKFMTANVAWITSYMQQYLTQSEFWRQIELFMIQTNGLTDGYKNAPKQPSTDIDPFGFWLFQVSGDMGAIDSALNLSLSLPEMWKAAHKDIGSGSCSALIKLLPDHSDVFVSQVTWNHYSSMLRILKKYDTRYRTLDKGSVIPGYQMAFSSYPGYLFSLDDFYILSSHMVVQETTIGNQKKKLWYEYVHPDGNVPTSLRAMAANRLATSGENWGDIFAAINSGTYNNEWMVVDYRWFVPGLHPSPLEEGFLTLIDQVPGFTVAEDITEVLSNKTYHASYNVPYFDSVYEFSGWPNMAKKYGDFFTYENCPRAKIFRRDHGKVKDMVSMIKLMRYNDFKHDPLSVCNCTPPYSGENAIAARSDLNPADGTYVLPVFGHRMHGATDVKVTSFSLSQQLMFYAQSGPTYDQQPPFRWSTSSVGGHTVRHEGMPDLFKFPTILVDWNH